VPKVVDLLRFMEVLPRVSLIEVVLAEAIWYGPILTNTSTNLGQLLPLPSSLGRSFCK